MPKALTDYNTAVIYRIVCRDLSITDTYVGSTTHLDQRRRQHKKSCRDPSDKDYSLPVHAFIRSHGNFDNWDVVLVESYPCANKELLHARERFHLEQLRATLNIRGSAAKTKGEPKNDRVVEICGCGASVCHAGIGPHRKGKRHSVWSAANVQVPADAPVPSECVVVRENIVSV